MNNFSFPLWNVVTQCILTHERGKHDLHLKKIAPPGSDQLVSEAERGPLVSAPYFLYQNIFSL
jgi:hypothetical protein